MHFDIKYIKFRFFKKKKERKITKLLLLLLQTPHLSSTNKWAGDDISSEERQTPTMPWLRRDEERWEKELQWLESEKKLKARVSGCRLIPNLKPSWREGLHRALWYCHVKHCYCEQFSSFFGLKNRLHCEPRGLPRRTIMAHICQYKEPPT